MTEKIDELLRGNDRTLKLVWFAMSAALLVYAGLPFFVPIDQEPSVPILVFAGMAAASAVGAVLYRRLQFSDAALVKLLGRPAPSVETLVEGIPEGVIRETLMERLEPLTPEERRLYGAAASMQTPYIIVWAMNESIGIFGLVGAFMGHDKSVVVPFMGAAFVLQCVSFPRILEIAGRLRNLALTTPVTGTA